MALEPPPRSRRVKSRAKFLLIGAVVALTLGASIMTGDIAGDRGKATSEVAGTKTPRTVTGANSAPLAPPARICGSNGLRGPASSPSGAIQVKPSQNLSNVVDRAPAGSTFWLEPGTHHLGSGQYSQVTPKKGDTFTGAPGAVIDGQYLNLYAFTGTAPNVTIKYLTIQNFGHRGDNNNAGVVNHDSGPGWNIQHNTIRRNAGAGVFIGSRNVVSHNCLSENRQYGFSAYAPKGVRNITLRDNEIVGNNTDDWEARRPGCGCSGGGKFWATRGATVVNNWVHDNKSVGLWADNNNSGFLIQGNYVEGNAAEGLVYETSYNAAILRNTFVRNGLVAGPENSGFPTPAVYISESGSDKRAGTTYGGLFRVVGNRFVDNWSGLIAWENADRFAGSPANTSTGVTTLVNPRVATEKACRDPQKIRTSPYYSDCRWKTQNLRVKDNTFKLTRSHIGSTCTGKAGCGYVGLVSNWGSYPSWSPYKGKVIQDHITFSQNNLWSGNHYVGPWRFMVHALWNTVSWDKWRSSPYRQDSSSTLR